MAKRKNPSSNTKTNKKETVFTLSAPKASDIRLVGDFNNWDQSAEPMIKDKNGLWKSVLSLSPGTYEYKFLVDGNWWIDPEKDKVWNPFGGENSVITV